MHFWLPSNVLTIEKVSCPSKLIIYSHNLYMERISKFGANQNTADYLFPQEFLLKRLMEKYHSIRNFSLRKIIENQILSHKELNTTWSWLLCRSMVRRGKSVNWLFYHTILDRLVDFWNPNY